MKLYATRRAVLIALLAFSPSALGAARVIEAGREAEVVALFAPYALSQEVAAGYKLWNVSIRPTEIELELSDSGGVTARLLLRERTPNDSEASESFAVIRDDASKTGAAKAAADRLVAALRHNDRGGFWRVTPDSDVQGGARRVAHTPDRRKIGLWLPIAITALTALFMILSARRGSVTSRSASARAPRSS